MDNKTIFLIIALVLVAGSSGGYAIANSLDNHSNSSNSADNSSKINNSSDDINSSSQNSSSDETTKKANVTTKNSQKQSNDGMISGSEAKNIVTKSMSGYGVKGKYAVLSKGKGGKPEWLVYIYNPDGSSAGICRVDAVTGAVLGPG